QERDRCERAICHCGISRAVVQQPISSKERNEERGGTALVSVGERVIFHYKVEKVRSFFFNSWVHVLARKALVHSSNCAFKRLATFPTSQGVIWKLRGDSCNHVASICKGQP